MNHITVGDIASRVRKPTEELGIAVDRVRYWTKEGLLSPVGNKNPGTGKRKRYPSDSIMKAAILQVLVDGTGAPATRFAKLLPQIAERLCEARSDEVVAIINDGTEERAVCVKPEQLLDMQPRCAVVIRAW